MRTRILLAALLALASAAFASDLTDAIAQANADLAKNTQDIKKASDDGNAASADYAGLIALVGPLKADIASWKLDVTAVKMDHDANHAAYQDLGQRMAVHDSNRCYYDQNHPTACAAYDAEADRLNAEKKALAARRDAIAARDAANGEAAKNLQSRANALSTNTQRDAIAMKDAKGKFEDLMVLRATIYQRLQELQRQVGDCYKLLRAQGQGSNDRLKNRCGNVQFDGTEMNPPYPQPPDPPSN
jgi:chromosome segregation ATPase